MITIFETRKHVMTLVVPFFLSLLCAASIHSHPLSLDIEQDSFDMLASDMFDGADDFANKQSSALTFPPDHIIDLLNQINAIVLLEENFFLRTNGINKQSLLDLPLPGNMMLTTDHCSMLGFDLFYNEVPRAFLTRDSSAICSYLAITQPNFLEKIQDIYQCTQNLAGLTFGVDITKALQAIGNMHVQQRSVGFMFFGIRQWGQYIGRFKLPFYYIERNFNLDPADLDTLEEALGVPIDRDQSVFELDPFVREHFISDKVGFGDTRLTMEQLIFYSEHFDYWVYAGGLVTIPTACTFGAGMVGRDFCKDTRLPNVNFDQLLDLAADYCLSDPEQQAAALAQAQATLSALFLNLFDRFAGTLLDTPLGNGGHFGFGAFLRTYSPLSIFIKERWATSIRMTSFLSAEYLAPHNEYRSYISVNDRNRFKQHDFLNLDLAAENLAFIEQELINRFFLVARKVRVQPGLIGRWNSKFLYQGNRWGAILGSDSWVQSRGSLHYVCPPNNGRPSDDIVTNKLDYKKNHPFMAYRSSVFMGVSYTLPCHDESEWRFSFEGDYAMSQVGIGHDFTVLFKLERHF